MGVHMWLVNMLMLGRDFNSRGMVTCRAPTPPLRHPCDEGKSHK